MNGLVYIIILNWNGWEDTVECIKTCRRLSYPHFRILILDNCSTDGSVSIISEKFPDIELIQTGANLGFAGGNNVGIRYALARGADYVWLLNNDTVVDVWALSALVTVAEGDERVGMVGSKIVYYDNPHLIWYAGAISDLRRPYRLGHRGLLEEDRGAYQQIQETGYITGCSLLARKEMIESVGFLDDALFLYFEDADWSARASAAGWKLMYSPGSVIRHKESASAGGAASPSVMYYTARNRLYFTRRNFPDRLLYAIAYDIYEHVLVNLKKQRIACAWAGIRGIIDFWLGKTGPDCYKS